MKIIRYKYQNEWEYSILHKDNTFTVICNEKDLINWRKNGQAIESFDKSEFSTQMTIIKVNLRDKKTKIIQGVWKKNVFCPQK